MKKKPNRTYIGGQAVLEGVMMRGKKSMALSVRDADGIVRLETYRIKPTKCSKIPIVRGIISFVSSLFGGTAVLMRSADVFGEGEPSKFEKWLAEKLKINIMSVIGGISLIIGLVLAIALFMILPQRVRIWVVGEDVNPWVRNLIEGGLKIFVFVCYILFCTLLKDIKRTFMYHGAEHKTISCYEKGLPLTPQNVKTCSRVHDRCGTTFIFLVMTVSIVLFACFESLLASKNIVLDKYIRILCKVAFLPLVAGLSYELLKALAKTENPIFFPLKIPGLLLQKLTTKEPTLEMIEVAISSFNAVLKMDADDTIIEQKFVIPEKCKALTERVKKELSDAGIVEDAEAEWIVSLTANIKRSEVYCDKLISAKNVEKINSIVKERKTNRPLWYCMGDTEFYGYKIKVDERVLIPRPETEILVENALKYITKEKSVLDLCTGSGCIAIAVNKQSGANVVAVDKSEDAIVLAKENAILNNAQVEFISSDMFSGLDDRRFDVIISNPPYVLNKEIETLQKEVKDFEPHMALDGGEDGLDFYKIIATKAKEYLTDNGVLLLECGENQAQSIVGLLDGYKNIQVIKDYENIERIIKAEK